MLNLCRKDFLARVSNVSGLTDKQLSTLDMVVDRCDQLRKNNVPLAEEYKELGKVSISNILPMEDRLHQLAKEEGSQAAMAFAWSLVASDEPLVRDMAINFLNRQPEWHRQFDNFLAENGLEQTYGQHKFDSFHHDLYKLAVCRSGLDDCSANHPWLITRCLLHDDLACGVSLSEYYRLTHSPVQMHLLEAALPFYLENMKKYGILD